MKIKYSILLLSIFAIFSCKQEKITSNEKAFEILEKIKSDRKECVVNYLNTLLNQAKSVKTDNFMNSFFKLKNEFSKKTITDSIKKLSINNQINEMEIDLVFHQINRYNLFYDILFIDNNGEIFHTILKEKDYKKNILNYELSKTLISQKIKNKPTEAFVDFQYYEFSDQPSAFFVEPVYDSNKIIGWFAFQVSINKLNNLLTSNLNLGKTGEVLLINKSQFILNNSRFNVKNTILKQKIPNKNLNYKFEKRAGNDIVVDYRNKRVLTSFEVFNFKETEWLISVKMDEDEIITEIFKNNNQLKKSFYKNIYRKAEIKNIDSLYLDKVTLNVNMDEYKRIDSIGSLYTKSVFTCTAILIKYPNKFAYLSHISPNDKIYGSNGTAILDKILKQIEEKEILTSEKLNLEFIIISPNDDALKNSIETIINNGYFLSQIKISLNNNAIFADVLYDFEKDETLTFWKIDKKNKVFEIQNSKSIDNIGEIFKSTIKD